MIRFFGGKVLTLNNNFDITTDEVWVDKNKIVYVGPEKKGGKFEREINLSGNLLMPTFKNAHTHSAMTFGRSYSDDLPLDRWLNEKIFPIEAKLESEDIYHLSKLAFLEYLTSGTSACFDMYYFPESMARASVDFGFRTVMCGAVNNFKESVEKLEEYYKTYNNYNELISYRLGFHAEYTTKREILEGISELAQKYKAPVFTHSSETKSEVEGCIERYGKTPTELFEDIGVWKRGGGGDHSVWLSDNDLQIYKKRGLWAIINAGSNPKLASGICDVQKMSNMGIILAVGTDGPSSNNALDMFREMYLISVLQKLKYNDAAAMDANEILKAATSGSAKCMGLTDCDCIAEGKLADLMIIDLERPNMQPINNITKNLVYSGSKDDVKKTMINGKILYENGEFVNIDKEEIYAKAQEICNRLKN